MVDTKISALPAMAALTGTEVFAGVQGGSTKIGTAAQILAYIKGVYYPQVANYAALPSSGVTSGDIYVVQATTGVIGFRKMAGLWQWNGTVWNYLGNIYLTASDTPFTPANGLVSTDTQSAVVEVQTNVNAKAASARLINTTAPLTGGGDLTADRTLGISAASGSAAGSMAAADFTKLAAQSGTNTGDQTSVTGNSGTATKLVTARNINATAFDGTADIVLPVFSSTVAGDVPASGGGTTKFLRADGAFAIPAGGGGATGTSTGLTLILSAKMYLN